MIKIHDIKHIITYALNELDGNISKPDQDGKRTIHEAKIKEDNNGDLILIFKEDCFDNEHIDKYRIKIEYIE